MVKIPEGAKKTWEAWGHFAHAKALLESLGLWEWAKTILVGTIVTAAASFLGWITKVPPFWLWGGSFILFIVACFLVAMFFAQRAISQMAIPTGPKEISAKRATKQEPSHKNVGPYIVIAAVILVAGAWYLFNHPNRMQYDQTRLIFVETPRPPISESHQFLDFNVIWVNSGPLTIDYFRLHYKFRESDNDLSLKEIDAEFDDVTSQVPVKDLFSNEIPAGGGGYVTMEDQRCNQEDCREVLDGKKVIYFFSIFKYEVDCKPRLEIYV